MKDNAADHQRRSDKQDYKHSKLLSGAKLETVQVLFDSTGVILTAGLRNEKSSPSD